MVDECAYANPLGLSYSHRLLVKKQRGRWPRSPESHGSLFGPTAHRVGVSYMAAFSRISCSSVKLAIDYNHQADPSVDGHR